MRLLLTGDLQRADQVRQVLDAAHLKRPITFLLWTGMTTAALVAEQWAGERGIMCGDVWEGAESSCIFDLAEGFVCLPGTSQEFLTMAEARGARVWQPFKVQSA